MKSRFDKDYATIGGETVRKVPIIKVWDIQNEEYIWIEESLFNPVYFEKVNS